MTPVVHDGSFGVQRRAPTSASEPRGSPTMTELDRGAFESVAVADREDRRDKSGPPSTTTRVGWLAVWESITCIIRSELPMDAPRILLFYRADSSATGVERYSCG